MDIEFEIKSDCSETDLMDFLFATFKPLKIEYCKGTYSNEHTFKLYNAEAVSPSHLEKEIIDYHERKRARLEYNGFHITRIEYSPKEKEQLQSIITFGKIMPPG